MKNTINLKNLFIFSIYAFSGIILSANTCLIRTEDSPHEKEI